MRVSEMPKISKRTGIIMTVMIFLVIGFRIYMDYPREVDPSMVFGTYTANYDTLECTLVLKEDWTYDYYLKTDGGEKYFNSNYWEIRDSEIGQFIVFDDFKYHYNPFPNPTANIMEGPFYLGLPIYMDYRGKIKIEINGDLGFYFSKQ
jgi:hypothetical protein